MHLVTLRELGAPRGWWFETSPRSNAPLQANPRAAFYAWMAKYGKGYTNDLKVGCGGLRR